MVFLAVLGPNSYNSRFSGEAGDSQYLTVFYGLFGTVTVHL